jgi:uncharacterized membrane protein
VESRRYENWARRSRQSGMSLDGRQERQRLRIQNRLAFSLSAAAVVWCFAAAIWMRATPMMSGGRRPSMGEALGMIGVPALAAAGATWASWHYRHIIMGVMTGVLGLFTFVTGFSIGGAFLPACGLLVWAHLVKDLRNERAGAKAAR